MKKIISLSQRNYDGDRLVRDEVVPGAEWVIADEGRGDLTIVEPSWMYHGWMGKVISGLVVDHACRLNENLRRGLLQAQTRIRP